MTLPDLFTNPIPGALLVLIIAVALYFQRTLSYREYRWWHSRKQRLFPPLSRLTSIFFVSEKAYRGADDEYVATVEFAPSVLYERLTKQGLSPHLISSLKKREAPDRRVEYSDLHFVKQHGETQSEVYCFVTDDGIDIYAHVEATVLTPEKHLEDTNQQDGDTRGVIPPGLIQEP